MVLIPLLAAIYNPELCEQRKTIQKIFPKAGNATRPGRMGIP